MKKTPKHIAIIMDGNGRWAKKNDLQRIDGHREGVKSVKKIVKHCVKLKIKYLTLYTLSKENFNRPKSEVLSLFKLLSATLSKEKKILFDNGVNFSAIGDFNELDILTYKKIKLLEKKTAKKSTLFLKLAINYSSRYEIISAVNKILETNENKIDEDFFNQYLLTSDLPDPDLLIRTGGEYRISNFLLWQIAYSELYFTEILWPDFNEKLLENAIDDFNKRERRFGRISEQITS